MLIQINENYRIKSDGEYNLTLERSYISKKTGETRWSVVGYYPKLEQALERALDDSVIRSTSTGISFLYAEIVKIKGEILEAVKGQNGTK